MINDPRFARFAHPRIFQADMCRFLEGLNTRPPDSRVSGQTKNVAARLRYARDIGKSYNDGVILGGDQNRYHPFNTVPRGPETKSIIRVSPRRTR